MTNQFSDPMKGPENQLNASGDFHQLALPFDHYSTVDVNSRASHRNGDRPVRDWMQVKSLGRIGLVLLVIGIAIAWTRQQGVWLAPSATAVATQTNILSVDAIRLEQADAFTIARHYSGEVVAGRTSELGFEQSGELVWVGVDRGDRVEVGQVLARLDIRQLQAQRSQLVAQRDQSQALLRELEVGPRQEDIDAARSRVQDLENQLQLSRIQETRREYLYEEGAISQEQLDEASFGAEALEDRMASAQSQLDELLAGTRIEQLDAQRSVVRQLTARIADIDIAIEKGNLIAPFSGVISERRMDEGTVVDGGQSVLRLVEDAQTEVEIGVPVEVATELELGSEHSIQIGNRTYRAAATAIVPEVDEVTRTRQVVFTVEPANQLNISPGQIAELTIAQATPESGYWVPTAALVPSDRGLWACYVLVEDDSSLEASVEASDLNSSGSTYRVERREVEVLHTDGTQSFIRGTVESGDRMVSSGTQRLVPGQQVRWAES